MITTIIFSPLFLSCSNDQIIKEEQKQNLEKDPYALDDSISIDGSLISCNAICDLGIIITETDTILFSEYDGTICCIYGPSVADPGDTLTFLYNSNLGDSSLTVSWDVWEGSLTLIDGQNTPFATFVCESDFTGGSLRGWGKSPEVINDSDTITIECSEIFYIVRKYTSVL